MAAFLNMRTSGVKGRKRGQIPWCYECRFIISHFDNYLKDSLGFIFFFEFVLRECPEVPL